MTKARFRVLGLALLLILSMTACQKKDDKAGISMTVAHTFDPSTFTVKSGETVTFTNASSESHTVTAYDDSIPDGADYFSSGGASDEQAARDDVAAGLVNPGETFTVTLDEPGTYRYFCIPHESAGMKGAIVVKP